MQIFDSSKKKKVDFVPIRNDEVRIYVCGPTVYDNAHLGHARSSIAFDLLRRILEANGYKVIFVKNITDIDDKIVKKSKESAKSVEYITEVYTQSYLDDMKALGVREPNLAPKATQNLESMFAMIKTLLAKDKAYVAKNGDIYMRVSSDMRYGELSNRANLESQISRIGENGCKDDVRDFALWKIFDKANDIAYDSPFGRGRPGWHIECSAMIETHLAHKSGEYSIDIHAGGADLLFPHHENEASQSRCANDKELAKYWIHNGFVNVNGEKMSKSLGNSFFVKDALNVYDGEVLRYYLLSMHYRSPLNFSHNDLLQSKKRLDRLYRLKKRLGMGKSSEILESNKSSANLESDKSIDNAFRADFLEALNDDINISIALSVLDSMIATYNDMLDRMPKDSAVRQKAMSNIAFVNELLGIGLKEPSEYFHLGVDSKTRQYIEAKITERTQAKAMKNYALSDSIRDELSAKNIILLDTKDGTIWEYDDSIE